MTHLNQLLLDVSRKTNITFQQIAVRCITASKSSTIIIVRQPTSKTAQ